VYISVNSILINVLIFKSLVLCVRCMYANIVLYSQI